VLFRIADHSVVWAMVPGKVRSGYPRTRTTTGWPMRTAARSRSATVELGPDERRGLTELNGDGEVASGIVLQRERDDQAFFKKRDRKLSEYPRLWAGCRRARPGGS
jgi:hypothetical protein